MLNAFVARCMTAVGLCTGCAAGWANEAPAPVSDTANQSAVQNSSVGQPDLKDYPFGTPELDPDEVGWVLFRDVKPDLWLVDRIDCRGRCAKDAFALLKRAKKMPQSFSDPKQRVQYDFIQCEGPMGLWLRTMPQAEALESTNGLVPRRYQSNAKGWGMLRPQVNWGYGVCLNPDGSFGRSFTVLDFDGKRMVAFVLPQILVYYRAVSSRNPVATQ